MSGPENETPSRSTRSRATSQASEPTSPPAPPEPASSSTGSTQPATAQASAAVSGAVTAVRERLQVGEQILLIGAALIVLDYIIFQVIFGRLIFIPDAVPVVTAVLAILAIWVQRWGHHDFGAGYRVLLAGFGAALLLYALAHFLDQIRFGISADALELLGVLLYWAGGAAALYGGWMMFRGRAR